MRCEAAPTLQIFSLWGFLVNSLLWFSHSFRLNALLSLEYFIFYVICLCFVYKNVNFKLVLWFPHIFLPFITYFLKLFCLMLFDVMFPSLSLFSFSSKNKLSLCLIFFPSISLYSSPLVSTVSAINVFLPSVLILVSNKINDEISRVRSCWLC